MANSSIDPLGGAKVGFTHQIVAYSLPLEVLPCVHCN